MIIIKADPIYLPIASAEIDTLRFRYERRSQAEARSWLSRAVDSGFPCYPWFEHDPLLQPEGLVLIRYPKG